MADRAKVIKFSGVGMHSGVKTNVVITLAKSGGILFKRTDLSDATPIPATWDSVNFSGMMNTTIGVAPNEVQTIEHFMAALFMSGISNAIIEIDACEFPIMDGGTDEFMKLLPCANDPMKKIIVRKEVIATRSEINKTLPFIKRIMLWLYNLKTGRREDGFVKLSPNPNGLEIDATLIYPDKIIGDQKMKILLDGTKKSYDNFIKNISKSRTFGRFWEHEYLKKRNMGKGANEDNVIVIMEPDDWDKIGDYAKTSAQLSKISKNRGGATLMPLHSADEFVRHKIIDAIGDLYTSGGFIYGTLESYKGSHGLNNLVLRKLFSDHANYEIIE